MKKLSKTMQSALEVIERNGIKNTDLPLIGKSTIGALLDRGCIEYVYRLMMIDATGCDESDRDQANEFLSDFLTKKEMLIEGFISADAWEDMKALIRYGWLVLKTNKRYDEISTNDDIETLQVEQELDECDELTRATNISRKITYNSGAWIEIDYVANVATVSDPENADLVELARLILTGFEECNKAVELQSKFTKTVAYIANPQDSRCSWWCVQIPTDQRLDGTRINVPFLKRGADLELKEGDMLIDSEAHHHRKNRGYSVVLIVCDGEKIQHLHPMAQRKAFIKAHGGQDLMHESGDVNGCIRMAVWLRRQPDLKIAIEQLLQA